MKMRLQYDGNVSDVKRTRIGNGALVHSSVNTAVRLSTMGRDKLASYTKIYQRINSARTFCPSISVFLPQVAVHLHAGER